MATFEYNALTSAGRLMTGTIEAASHEQAGELLKDMQLTVNEIVKARLKMPKTAIGRSEFLLFNQQLASITKTGIPLEKGLREIAADVASRRMRKLITEIADELERGSSIEDAIQKRQRHFPALYGQILKAGVESGRLSEMLTSLNRHLELAATTRRIIFEALCYPAVVFALTAVIITLIFVVVVPPFAEVLADMTEGRAGLPALTQWFLAMADHVAQFWGGVGLSICAIVIVFILLSGAPAGRRFKESVLLQVPVIGRVYHCGSLAKMAEAMALLVGAGCTMPTCLRLGSGASGSEKLKLECELLAGRVEEGTGIVEAGHFCRMIPRLFLYSVQLGSQRNELQDNLHGLGEMYSQQTRCMQARLQSILPAALIIFLGLIVGLMVLSMFLPLIRMITVMM
jgi:type II secretory pathway component PulF